MGGPGGAVDRWQRFSIDDYLIAGQCISSCSGAGRRGSELATARSLASARATKPLPPPHPRLSPNLSSVEHSVAAPLPEPLSLQSTFIHLNETSPRFEGGPLKETVSSPPYLLTFSSNRQYIFSKQTLYKKIRTRYTRNG